ncbi:glycosyltransferase family 4 protein [Psychroserpens sp. Hel_I_66]|uniref:glycosyltransferase family 4 protein n=1 Tax=Psychroserpens sp. Hel_I_66 TaxID=1250004 RepID=UPI0006454BDC|nr:glycosyltransferase family 4 protein [Psychroserpens sp. Hel_I_66]
MPKTILYIHQSAELYGSDKALFYLVKGISAKQKFNPIIVLPNDGPLKDLLESHNIRVIIFPVIKVSRSMFKPLALIKLPFTILRTTKGLNKILKNESIDLIHSNTLAVLLGGFYARRYKIKHIWHVHEIIKKPKIVSFFYPLIVRLLSQQVVFNSKASKDFLCKDNKALEEKSIVNLNGIDRDVFFTSEKEIIKTRNKLFNANKDDIVLALVGRISKWKGQHLLLDAFVKCRVKYKNLRLIFVGSAPPNQEHLLEDLNNKIEIYNLQEYCKIIPFRKNIWNIWDSIDIAVVPSTEPEPFGLVALEAMLAKKPVIAAKHGGLKEIVDEDKTGFFFKPNDSKDLSKVIKQLVEDKSRIIDLGLKGSEKAIKDFSLTRHINQFVQIYDKM